MIGAIPASVPFKSEPMKAIQANLLRFLYASPQFVIPIYQRNYSWTRAQCQQLWNDLLRAGRNSALNAHFIGSIVYVENGLLNVTRPEPLLVIDGQQRLTTCTLLIAALASHFEKNGLVELLDSFSAKKLRNYYLLNPNEDGERHFKLLLSETDKDTLLALLQSRPLPDSSSTRIVENHALFQTLIEQHKDELPAICQGLAKLVIVDVSLDRSQDNPQLIFESMNSTGLELSQADLIRNFILMGLEPALQTELYKAHWRPMEKGFGQDAYATHFDDVLQAYRPQAAKTGQSYRLDDHPQFASVPLRELFHALQQAVLALDPCVNEEVLKLYIAYKAETNFVDVVPQTRRLRLSLNMPFHEIDDPKGLCRDVTHLGRWGNGCVEVSLTTQEELPYVMGLIRQSFERQMDDMAAPG